AGAGAVALAHAGQTPQSSLSRALRNGMQAAGRQSGAYVVDLNTGQTLFSSAANTGRLPAQSGMPAVAARTFHRQAYHLFYAGVALIKVKGNDLGIAIHAQSQLGQIVGADGETVEQFCEGIDQDDVVGDLAHDVDLQSVIAT